MNLELSNDEKVRIRQLLMSEGWKTLIEKVWNPMWNEQSQRCATCVQDHRYEQGLLEGQVRMVRYAHESVQDPEDIQATIFASEAALTSRRYRPFR